VDRPPFAARVCGFVSRQQRLMVVIGVRVDDDFVISFRTAHGHVLVAAIRDVVTVGAFHWKKTKRNRVSIRVYVVFRKKIDYSKEYAYNIYAVLINTRNISGESEN